MGVVADISMSLDGYVTAPVAGIEHGLGVDGEALHRWVFAGNTQDDANLLRETFQATGAVIMGRRTFDVVDGPHGWSDDMGYGGKRDGSPAPPNFVVTHRVPEEVRMQGAFTFVTSGISDAIELATAAAGDKDVFVMGGGNVISQCVQQGLVDELRIHLAPVVFGGGTRLFDEFGSGGIELAIAKVIDSPTATHLTYRPKS